VDNYWKMHTATIILKRENPTLSEIDGAKETLLALSGSPFIRQWTEDKYNAHLKRLSQSGDVVR
jgi:hypothetical protein